MPRFPFAGRVLAGFLAQNGQILEASSPGMANLLASGAPFCHLDFEPRVFAPWRVGGRQLLHFGSLGGLETAPICISGTHNCISEATEVK